MQLHVEFMNAPRGSLSRAANAVKKADGGIFWWSIAIVILMALAATSWIASIFIFTHPEKPYNYKLLSRIQRLEEIKLFNEKDMPAGKSLTPPELYQKFYPFTDKNLGNHNSLLRRNRHQLQLRQALGRAHDIGRIDRLVGGNENEGFGAVGGGDLR